MKEYRREDIEGALKALNIAKGDMVFVHSSLFPLGLIKGSSVRDLPRIFYEEIISCIGDEGTLVVPAFNFGFCKGEAFNHTQTPSIAMGAFSEYVRKSGDSYRSSHPMQSIAAIGSKAKALCSLDTTSVYAQDGCFGELLRSKAKLLLIGLPVQTISFVHYLEEYCQVPYRFWKSFKGNYIYDGKSSVKEYKMYARDLKLDPYVDLTPLEEEFAKSKVLEEINIGGEMMRSISFQDFFDIGFKCITNDPYFLVANCNEKVKQ
jgi:aminoglycoside 3-N-acetyltransferase